MLCITIQEQKHQQHNGSQQFLITLLQGAGFTVEKIEIYTRHRPFSAFTVGVSQEVVQTMQTFLADLNSEQCAKLNLNHQEGQLWLDHWYVMIHALL